MSRAVAKAVEAFKFEQDYGQVPLRYPGHVIESQSVNRTVFPFEWRSSPWSTLWHVDGFCRQRISVMKMCLEVKRTFETVNDCYNVPGNFSHRFYQLIPLPIRNYFVPD